MLCEVFGGRELGTILDADARTQAHAQRRDRCGHLYNASGHLFDMVGDVCEGSWGTGSEVPFGCDCLCLKVRKALFKIAGECEVSTACRVSEQVSKYGEREQTTRCFTEKHGAMLCESQSSQVGAEPQLSQA